MTSNDADPVVTALAGLRTQDVDARRAHRLQLRCRAALAAQRRAADAAGTADPTRLTLVAGPALLAVWCAVYVIEMMRLAGVIYRL